MLQGYIYFGFSKGNARFKKPIAKKKNAKFNSSFTKAVIVFTTFTEKERQIINFIKTNEILVIILMWFTIALRKTNLIYFKLWHQDLYILFLQELSYLNFLYF